MGNLSRGPDFYAGRLLGSTPRTHPCSSRGTLCPAMPASHRGRSLRLHPSHRQRCRLRNAFHSERRSPIPIPDSDLDPDTVPDAFDRRSQLAGAVAEPIALAVANLDLRESLRLQAVRDPLTGFYNRRYMQEFLERELHSARRKHRSLAVMMLDLDHFKRYNDNFGHTAGDQALAAVGQALLRIVRAEDVACRYGGEEFAIILPECSLQQATGARRGNPQAPPVLPRSDWGPSHRSNHRLHRRRRLR